MITKHPGHRVTRKNNWTHGENCNVIVQYRVTGYLNWPKLYCLKSPELYTTLRRTGANWSAATVTMYPYWVSIDFWLMVRVRRLSAMNSSVKFLMTTESFPSNWYFVANNAPSQPSWLQWLLCFHPRSFWTLTSAKRPQVTSGSASCVWPRNLRVDPLVGQHAVLPGLNRPRFHVLRTLIVAQEGFWKIEKVESVNKRCRSCQVSVML